MLAPARSPGGGTSRSTTLMQRRAAQAGARDRELDAPRTEIDREDSRLAISLFLQEHPRAVRHGRLPNVLRHDLGVPHAGDRRADRREHRRAVGVLLLALDLAPRLRRGRCGAGRRVAICASLALSSSRPSFSPARPGMPARSRAPRRAAGHRARSASRATPTDAAGSFTNVMKSSSVVNVSPNCFALRDVAREQEQPRRVRGCTGSFGFFADEVQDRGDQLRVRRAPTGWSCSRRRP